MPVFDVNPGDIPPFCLNPRGDFPPNAFLLLAPPSEVRPVSKDEEGPAPAPGGGPGGDTVTQDTNTSVTVGVRQR